MMMIRKGLEKDLTALQELLEEAEMRTDVNPEDFLVAEEAGAIAGAVRLEWIGHDVYLRAMAVLSNWRGQGVGSKLVKELVSGLEQVKVVARGPAVPFYEKLEFRTVEWAVIDKEMSRECVECPDVFICKPEPMIYERNINDKINE